MDQQTLSSLIWLRMARFVHQSNQLSNEYLARFDLTASQFDVLVNIQASEPITQMDLAAKLTVSHGGISRMVARLEEDGLIERKQQWKVKYITLTEKGHAVLNRALPHQEQFQSSFFDEALQENEKLELYRLLTKVQKHSVTKKVPPM